MNKQQSEAESVNLTLLSKADKTFGKGYANYNLYLFNNCGHKQYLQPTHVRRNNIVCHVCKELAIKKEAEETFLIYMGKPDNEDVNFRRYKFKDCGHESDMRFASVSKRTTNRCQVCYEESLKVIAVEKGLTYIGTSDLNGIYRRYKFNACLHIKDIAAPCVAIGTFECKDCITEEKEQLCKDNGLEIIDKHEDRYWTFRLPCNHLKRLRVDHAVDDSWLCDECGDSHYTKPSIVYLYKFSCPDFEWLKLGYSRNLSLRRTNYKTPKNCEAVLLYSKNIETGAEAQRIEKSIHRKLKALKLCKKFMTQYMQSNGHTECYPVDALEHILKELDGQ